MTSREQTSLWKGEWGETLGVKLYDRISFVGVVA